MIGTMNGMNDNLHVLLPLAAAATATAATGALALISVAPRCRAWGDVVYRGSTMDMMQIALTFDDGPTEGATDKILDTLAEMNVPAAFFVVGANGERWPQLLRRIHDEGHVVGNHSFEIGRAHV